MAAPIRHFSPVETARCLGVSVKALRHFETLGLVSPGRSPAGRRVYAQEDLARLQQVLALRGAGFGSGRLRGAFSAAQLFAAGYTAQEVHKYKAVSFFVRPP